MWRDRNVKMDEWSDYKNGKIREFVLKERERKRKIPKEVGYVIESDMWWADVSEEDAEYRVICGS